MKDNCGSFSIHRMAYILSVSPSEYYLWLKSCQQLSKRKQARDTKIKDELSGTVLDAFLLSLKSKVRSMILKPLCAAWSAKGL